MLITLHAARDAGLIGSYGAFDEPRCFLFDTETRAFEYIGAPASPYSVMPVVERLDRRSTQEEEG